MSAADADRYRSLVKLLQLEQLLAGKRWRPSLDELAAVLDVTPRTVIRYLNVLRRVGRVVPPARPAVPPGGVRPAAECEPGDDVPGVVV